MINPICKNKKCNKPLIQKTDNKIKVRTNIMIFEKGKDGLYKNAIIKCPYCKEDNKMPINFDSKESEKTKDLKHFISMKK